MKIKQEHKKSFPATYNPYIYICPSCDSKYDTWQKDCIGFGEISPTLHSSEDYNPFVCYSRCPNCFKILFCHASEKMYNEYQIYNLHTN